MISRLRTLLDPVDRGVYARFLCCAALYGIAQGATFMLLLPIARSLAEENVAETAAWLLALCLAAAGCSAAHYAQAMLGSRVALLVLRSMHLTIGEHLTRLPLGWFAGRIGSLSQIATTGTLSVGNSAGHLVTPLIVGITAPATVIIGMLILEWRLGLLLLLAAPVVALASRFEAARIARSNSATHAATDETNDRIIEFAAAQRTLRAAGRTGHSGQETPLDRAVAHQAATIRRSILDAVAGLTVMGVVTQLVFTAAIVDAAALALNGAISGIEFLALLGIVTRFIQPLGDIGELGGAVRQISGELDRIDEVLTAEPLRTPETSAPIDRPGTIEFDDVSFGYAPNTPVLEQITFLAEPGTLTALVGPSGSGKTTLTRLIARFFDVQRGAVRVGGADVRELSPEQLMAQLSLVFQDVYLFNDTLRANIRFGRPEASDAEVAEAASLAGVTEIAARLPDGWDTPVGEGGSALSGGERQRVSIARAILKEAPIVLLDEATASLDPENERWVAQSVQRLREHATLLVIAHTLSTVTAADLILVLDDDGRIVERGGHEELLAAAGRYAGFWAERTRATGWQLAQPPPRPAP